LSRKLPFVTWRRTLAVGVALAVLAACGPPPPPPPPPPWAATTTTTANGYVSTGVGCAANLDASGLNAFFSARIGPVLGWDYQHVYPLGGDRWLWLFQDSFIDHPGRATTLDGVGFAHNAALVQTGRCFTLLHRGTVARPSSFEPGAGEQVLTRWWWPLGGELANGRLRVFWAEMVRDPVEPPAGDGLGWHPVANWLGTYDAASLTRLDFRRAPDAGAEPLYGYAIATAGKHTYLFGNTYQQNLALEGGFWSGPHSATKMWLARVPAGQLDATPEYWSASGWTSKPNRAEPFLDRFWAENPMQPAFIDGRWLASTKADGFWGASLFVDVAEHPWGPWLTVDNRPFDGRDGNPLLNSYHVQPLPWTDSKGNVILSVSNNAQNMRRDAYPHPERYRPSFFAEPLP
jgi:hypothetical protein